MKKLTLYLMMLLALPVAIHAQNTGGNGRGDILVAIYGSLLNGTDGIYTGGNGRGDVSAAMPATSPLPVELASFTSFVDKSKVILHWNTATEVKNYGFEIERTSPRPSSSQGEVGEARRGWQKIGFVQGNGNSNSPKEYSYTDNTTTSGKYVYRLKQLDNDGKYEYSKEVEADLGMPTEFSLKQNYPNPFNPETVISYQLPVSGKASLKVFDMLGREVATLVDEVKEAGTYDVSFNGKAFASGTYFYRFQSGNFVKINKMILMK